MKRGSGYIAIDRGIFDHWIARNAKRFKAWQWLIAEAAHAPMGKRGTWGVVHVERGELVGSIRTFAAKWRWTKSSVDRFLKRLANEGMVRLRTTRLKTGTPSGTATAPFLEHDVTVITICNYDAFQNSSTAAKAKAGHQPGHRSENDDAQSHMFPGFCEPLTTEPLNHTKQGKGPAGEGEVKRQADTPPRHGAHSKKHGTVFVLYGTEDWRVYAEDFKATAGAEPLPNRWGGYWFYANGEAARPAHQRTWRDPNAFGRASRGRA